MKNKILCLLLLVLFSGSLRAMSLRRFLTPATPREFVRVWYCLYKDLSKIMGTIPSKMRSKLPQIFRCAAVMPLQHEFSREESDRLTSDLIDAAERGSTERLTNLLRIGAYVYGRTERGETALHWAALQGHLACLKLLLTQKAEVNSSNENGTTPLHWAAESGHRDCIEALVKGDADVLVCDKHGKAPLNRAIENNHVDAVKMLVKYSYRIRLSKRAVYDSRKRIVNALLLFARVRKRLEEGGLQLTDLGNISLQFEILSKSKLLQKDLVLILLDELQEGREMRPGLLSKSKDAAVEYLLEMVTEIVSKNDQSTMTPALRDLLDRSTIKELLKEGLNERYDQLKVKKNT